MSSEYAKDTTKKWFAEDEISFANAVLTSSVRGQVNMRTFYKRAKETLQSESHGQVYEMMKHMRSIFWTIESHLRDGKITEELFPYRSPHEAGLYKVWKQIRGHHERRNEVSQDIEMQHNRELWSRSYARQLAHNEDVNEGRHESRTEVAYINGELRIPSHPLQCQNGEVTDYPPEEEEEEKWRPSNTDMGVWSTFPWRCNWNYRWHTKFAWVCRWWLWGKGKYPNKYNKYKCCQNNITFNTVD